MLPPPTKKRHQKPCDNHISVRIDVDMDSIISRRMERTGETQSEAIRAIIVESERKEGNVYITSKAPPKLLEILLGMLSKWRKDFVIARPRLNIPTPASDNSRYAEVMKWRKESDRLLVEIPKLEETVKAAIAMLTSLTPEKIAALKSEHPTILKRQQEAMEKNWPTITKFLGIIVEVLEDMGIVQPEDQK